MHNWGKSKSKITNADLEVTDIQVIAEVKGSPCGKQRAENMALESRNMNEIQRSRAASKGYRKRRQESTMLEKSVKTFFNG